MILEICVGLLFVSIAFAYYLFIRVACALQNDILQLTTAHNGFNTFTTAVIRMFEMTNCYVYANLYAIDKVIARCWYNVTPFEPNQRSKQLFEELSETLNRLTFVNAQVHIQNIGTVYDEYIPRIFVITPEICCSKTITPNAIDTNFVPSNITANFNICYTNEWVIRPYIQHV